MEIANACEAVQDGRIYIKLDNAPFLKESGTPDQYRAALARAHVGLAVAARIRDLCEVHASGRRAVRLIGLLL